ncbi:MULTISPECIES: hypothetical protein [unclassified Stenotrophomonas maltophilia group]|uniref:hypothetical protein n=1 Tax=unclassified Stenotrophomonas maltophilia group TaxID=2961925 RepID=UPI003BF8580A
MTTSVDVLSVMANAIETYTRLNREARSEEDHLLDIEDSQAARAAVAELIESCDHLKRDATNEQWAAFHAALARVKGA